MAYRPPTTSKWDSKPVPDVDGWQTVGPKPTKSAKPAKWGESALKKAAPPAPTHDELFPAFPSKKPVSPTIPVEPHAEPAEAKPTLAERMKARLAAEEEEQKRKAEEERNRKAEEENRFKGSFVPVASILATRSFAKDFAYQDPAEEAEYYNEYPEHYVEDHDYEEAVEYEDDY